jgi:hypothetical protein
LRRFIPVFVFTLLLFTIFSFCQCQFRSPHLFTFNNKSLKETINSTNQTTPITKIIVVSHYNEDLDWLDLFIGERIPHIVYTRSADPLTRHNIKINKGREAVAYLQYIVDNYSNLPSLIAFVHGHRTSWHQKNPSDIVVALRALRWNKYNYTPLTSSNFMTEVTFRINTQDQQTKVNHELWRDVLQKELGPPPANGTRAHCCASFVVKKEAVLAHPKIFYSNIIDYIVASPYSDQSTGRTLEFTWHIIFGDPPHSTYKTCDVFVCDANGTISVQLAEKNQ